MQIIRWMIWWRNNTVGTFAFIDISASMCHFFIRGGYGWQWQFDVYQPPVYEQIRFMVHGSWSPSHASRILYPPYVLIVRKLLMQNGLLISTQTKRKSHILFIMHVQKESERKKNGSKRTTRTRDTNTSSTNCRFSRVLIGTRH